MIILNIIKNREKGFRKNNQIIFPGISAIDTDTVFFLGVIFISIKRSKLFQPAWLL